MNWAFSEVFELSAMEKWESGYGLKNVPIDEKHLTKIEVETAPEAEDAVSEILSNLFGVSPVVFHNFEKGTVSVSVYDENGRIAENKSGLVDRLNGLKNVG
jgi:hypothetical protein